MVAFGFLTLISIRNDSIDSAVNRNFYGMVKICDIIIENVII